MFFCFELCFLNNRACFHAGLIVYGKVLNNFDSSHALVGTLMYIAIKETAERAKKSYNKLPRAKMKNPLIAGPRARAIDHITVFITYFIRLITSPLFAESAFDENLRLLIKNRTPIKDADKT